MLRKDRIVRMLVLAGAAALAACLLDPRAGKARRARLRDQVGGVVRRWRRDAERRRKYVEGKVEGVQARLAGAASDERSPTDDRVIVDEIKAALARLEYPTTDVNVDVVAGTAGLRGQLQRPEQISEVRDVAAAVRGVARVESYLHLPNTPAPNKASSLDTPGSAGSVVNHGA